MVFQMNIKTVKNSQKNQNGIEKELVKNKNSEFIDGTNIKFICAFYEKCTFAKNESFCNQFPDFMICPDYILRRNKIFNENEN